jgi:hypothetical protein
MTAPTHIDTQIIIKDDVMDPEKIGQYHLSLGFSDTEFTIGIVDNENHRCLFFESLQIPNLKSVSELTTLLEHTFEEHSFLAAGFWQGITVFVRNQQFTLIPDDYYTEDKKEEWLCMATGAIDQTDEVLAYYHKSLKSHMVFSIPPELKSWIMAKYPLVEIKFTHQLSALIEGCALMTPSVKKPYVFAHIDQRWLSLLVFDNLGLQAVNRFICYEPIDFAKYTLMAYKQYGLDPEEDSLTLYGNFNSDSPVLEKILRYVKHVKQGKRPWKLYFAYPFDELEDHKYFATFSAWFCK